MVNLIKDNERGDLMAFDTMDIPFYVKRIFVVNNVPINEVRGQHAHRENLQFLICLNGIIQLKYHTGKNFVYLNLNKGETFLLNKMQWCEQLYFKGAELMVLCSHEYDKEDYITDFEEFKRLINGN